MGTIEVITGVIEGIMVAVKTTVLLSDEIFDIYLYVFANSFDRWDRYRARAWQRSISPQ